MNECARASALLVLLFGCGDGDRSKAQVPTASSSSSLPPSASVTTSEASRFSSSAPVVARRVSKLPEIVDPDPVSLAPMPRALDPQIACATPRVPGRRLPKGASARVRGLYDACRAALEREPSEASPNPSGEKGDPSAPTGLRACTALGRILNRGFGAPENATLGANLEARACGLGELDACAELATATLSGHGAPFDPACGDAVLRWACDQGGALGCTRLGRLAQRGELVAFDPDGAKRLFARACDRGAYAGCLSLANSIQSGEAAKALELEGRAASLAEASCHGGDGQACTDLVWLHGPNRDGQPFSPAYAAAHRDPTKVAELSKMACRFHLGGCSGNASVVEEACKAGDFERCIDLAFEHANAGAMGGAFGPSDQKALERACLGGSSRGCWALGDRHSESLFDDACEGGELTACRSDPRSHVLFPSPPDKQKKGCDQGSAIDCRELGERAIKRSQVPEAIALFERACPSFRSRADYRDVDARACAEAGRRYRKGEGVARDPERAVELLLTGCFAQGRLNERGEGCAELAEMFDTGDGVVRDRERATDLLAGLCYAQRKGCDELALRLPTGQP